MLQGLALSDNTNEDLTSEERTQRREERADALLFDIRYDACRQKIRKVQRVVRKELNTWVIAGSCLVVFFGVLFIIVRLWVFHTIHIAEVQSESRNVLAGEIDLPPSDDEAEPGLEDVTTDGAKCARPPSSSSP